MIRMSKEMDWYTYVIVHFLKLCVYHSDFTMATTIIFFKNIGEINNINRNVHFIGRYAKNFGSTDAHLFDLFFPGGPISIKNQFPLRAIATTYYI